MPRLPVPLLAVLLAAGLGGCAFPDDAGEGAHAGDPAPEGPRFVLVIDNQLARQALVAVRTTGPDGADVVATVPGAAGEQTREILPLATEGAHAVRFAYDAGEGGQSSSGVTSSAFDTRACAEGTLPRVTLRLFERDGVVHAGADAACAADGGGA